MSGNNSLRPFSFRVSKENIVARYDKRPELVCVGEQTFDSFFFLLRDIIVRCHRLSNSTLNIRDRTSSFLSRNVSALGKLVKLYIYSLFSFRKSPSFPFSPKKEKKVREQFFLVFYFDITVKRCDALTAELQSWQVAPYFVIQPAYISFTPARYRRTHTHTHGDRRRWALRAGGALLPFNPCQRPESKSSSKLFVPGINQYPQRAPDALLLYCTTCAYIYVTRTIYTAKREGLLSFVLFILFSIIVYITFAQCLFHYVRVWYLWPAEPSSDRSVQFFHIVALLFFLRYRRRRIIYKRNGSLYVSI